MTAWVRGGNGVPSAAGNAVMLWKGPEIRGKCKEPKSWRRIKETPGGFRRPSEKRDRERSVWGWDRGREGSREEKWV